MNPGLPEEQQFPLSQGTVTIGRTKDNAVFCLHKSLSRKHAQVEFDGVRVKITDLQSKNGIFVNGKRVDRCELMEGDRFRCGDITFLVEGTTLLSTKVSNRGPSPQQAQQAQDRSVQTLPSPFALDPNASRRPALRSGPQVTVEGEQRYKDKLFLLIRASELCVSELSIDRVLDELIALAVQVLEVDRIALLTLDDVTLEMRPRVIKTFVAAAQYPYSTRVLGWVVDHGSPASFADVSRDRRATSPETPTSAGRCASRSIPAVARSASSTPTASRARIASVPTISRSSVRSQTSPPWRSRTPR